MDSQERMPHVSDKDFWEVRAEAERLRIAILCKLRDDGPQRPRDLAEQLGKARSTVSDCLQRMIKNRTVRVERNSGRAGDAAIAIYHFVSMEGGGEGCSVPRRPVYQVYPPNKVCDPYALPLEFFHGARA